MRIGEYIDDIDLHRAYDLLLLHDSDVYRTNTKIHIVLQFCTAICTTFSI